MLVNTGATFTKAPRDLLERLGVPVESTYTAELADGSRVERTRGRTVIRLEGKEFPTPVTFGEAGEQNLLGAMALEDAMLAVDPHSRRLIPVDALEMTAARQNERGKPRRPLKQQATGCRNTKTRPATAGAFIFHAASNDRTAARCYDQNYSGNRHSQPKSQPDTPNWVSARRIRT